MRGIVALLICFVAIEARHFNNPVLSGADYPDPGVILVDGVYYAVTTTNNHESEKLPMFRSTDLQGWEHIGFVFNDNNMCRWSNRDLEFWAPEIHRVEDSYRIYFTSRYTTSGKLSIGVASADNVAGPYRCADEPIWPDPNGDVLDSTLINDNGMLYLLWKGAAWIYGRPLNADGLSFAPNSEIKEILINDQPWEGFIVEAPFYARRNEFHYLFYSGNHYCGDVYGVGIARSLNPLGPYEKHDGPILSSTDTLKGPGHCSVVKDIIDGNNLAMIFHAFQPGEVCGPGGEKNRLMNVASVAWDDATGWPYVYDL